MIEPTPIGKLSKDDFEILKKNNLLKRIYPDAPDFYEHINPVRPQRIPNPNFDKVIANVESIIAEMEKNNGLAGDDDAHYLYEDVMNAVYGKDIWDYIKRIRKKHGF